MTNVELFTLDLRRILYLQEILMYSLDAMKSNPVTPPWLKYACNNNVNSMKHIKSELARRGSADSWQEIYEDISDDRLHDIALHIDFIAPVKNIAQITAIMQSSVEPIQL